MVKESIIPIENKKPVELVQEFKDYEIKKSPLSKVARSKVIKKYGSGYISESDGYGPCSSCGNSSLFKLTIILKCSRGGNRWKTVHSVDAARMEARDIRIGKNHWVNNHPKHGNVLFSDEERKSLFDNIDKIITDHMNGADINTSIDND